MAEINLGMNINEDPAMQMLLSLSKNINLKQIVNETVMSDEDIDEEIVIIITTELCMIQKGIENSSNELEHNASEDIDNILILENCGIGLNLKDFSEQFINIGYSDNEVIYVSIHYFLKWPWQIKHQ